VGLERGTAVPIGYMSWSTKNRNMVFPRRESLKVYKENTAQTENANRTHSKEGLQTQRENWRKGSINDLASAGSTRRSQVQENFGQSANGHMG